MLKIRVFRVCKKKLFLKNSFKINKSAKCKSILLVEILGNVRYLQSGNLKKHFKKDIYTKVDLLR